MTSPPIPDEHGRTGQGRAKWPHPAAEAHGRRCQASAGAWRRGRMRTARRPRGGRAVLDALGGHDDVWPYQPWRLPELLRSVFRRLRNCCQVGPARRGAGSIPAVRRISQTVDGATVTPSFVTSPWIRRYPQSGFSFASRMTRRAMLGTVGGRPAGLAPAACVVLARGQLAVPGQQRRWRDGEDLGPAVAGYEPGQRGEPYPVGRLVTHPADVAAQHRVLVPEYQQFSILCQVRAGHQNGQAEYPAN